MKKSGFLVVSSVAAASATAISASSSSCSDFCHNSKIQVSCEEISSRDDRDSSSSGKSTTSKDKFAPRFDGLRFIETLVTAHR